MVKTSLVLALAVFVLNAYSQTCKQKAPPAAVAQMAELKGEWRGEITQNNLTYPIEFNIYQENQELKVKITNATQSPSGALADASLCSTNKFHFFGQRVNGESFAYNAKLINAELVGDLTIGDNCSKENRNTFRLRKVKT